MFAYAVIGEALLREFFHGIEPWLVSTNAAAWIQKSYTIYIYPEGNCNSEAACRPDTIKVELLDAAVYLGVIGAVVLGASLLVFQRRDVP